jgi:hypothetical protein
MNEKLSPLYVRLCSTRQSHAACHMFLNKRRQLIDTKYERVPLASKVAKCHLDHHQIVRPTLWTSVLNCLNISTQQAASGPKSVGLKIARRR